MNLRLACDAVHLLFWIVVPVAQAQPPVVPKPASTGAVPAAEKTITAPTEDNPEATAAETSGPISVSETVSDESLRRKLEKLLPRYPGVRKIEVEVEEGVITLSGHVADQEVRDRLRDFVRRVQGVNLVLNRTKTDLQVLSAREFATKQLRAYGEIISRKWILWLFAVSLMAASTILAPLAKRYSEPILSLFTGNALLRSVFGSVFAVAVFAGGFLTALHLLGMSEAVLSFLGLAGVVALAVGFAFRDIAENFIASVMLGFRRPFRMGDVIEVAGKSGVVRSLNTRATVLVTLDGSQVRIPNAVIFKELIVNKSASTSVRGSFDVMIPWDTSIATAISAISGALREHEGFEDEPPPRTLVEAIEPGGIRLRAYFWFRSRGIDRWKLQSDAQLAAKVALQAAGIQPPAPSIMVRWPVETERGRSPRESGQIDSEHTDRSAQTAEKSQASLRYDSEAAAIASAQRPQDQEDEVDHALEVSCDGEREEGRNLIPEKEGRE